MLFYLQVFIQAGGWVVVLFGIVGLAYTIVLKQPSILLLYFGAGYWVALSRLGLHWERWSLPMMITPLLLAALGMTKLWETIKQQRWLKIFAITLLGVFVSIYTLNGVTSSVLLTWLDTRVVALQFTKKNDITQENSVYEGYTPFIPRTVKTIFDFDFDNPGQIEFVILSSNMYGRFEAEPERYTSENSYYTNLRAKATLIGEFKPSQRPENPLEQLTVIGNYLNNKIKGTKTTYTTGPTIQIYQLP